MERQFFEVGGSGAIMLGLGWTLGLLKKMVNGEFRVHVSWLK